MQTEPAATLRFPFHHRIFVEAFVCLLVYVLFMPQVAMPLYNKIILFPDSHDYEKSAEIQLKHLATLGCSKKDVYFTSSNGALLHGWLFSLPEAEKVVLVSHGNGGNIATRVALIEALITCGTSVFLYDYEGYGKSQGQPTVNRLCDDATGAFDYLVESEKLAPRNIVAYGESVGTGVTCELSERRQVGAIILQSGFPSLVYAAHDRLWFTWLYPESWFPKLDCLSRFKREHPPLLIIHGQNDPFFAPSYSEVIYDSALQPKKLIIINQMGHSVEDADDQPFQNAVKSFFESLKEAR